MSTNKHKFRPGDLVVIDNAEYFTGLGANKSMLSLVGETVEIKENHAATYQDVDFTYKLCPPQGASIPTQNRLEELGLSGHTWAE